MSEKTTVINANLKDFKELVAHQTLDFSNPVTRDAVRKVAFAAMKRCSREEAVEIQKFLDTHGCS